ncbi:LuxR C-terminal-related transcriptional regulator [Microbacterium sp. KR10-403]|uniref:response regulator transcription factor n=1 Tax=Microbacterium sp. KR10-403 TaxID=3158581 RepID=UPI0032E36C96
MSWHGSIGTSAHTDGARPLPTRARGAAMRREEFSDLDLVILRLVAEGHAIDSIARELNVSARTVRRHTHAMRDRFGARAPIQVAVWAARRGII